MKRPSVSFTSLGTIVVLGLTLAPTALAHGSEHGHESESADSGSPDSHGGEKPQYPETYFSHAEFAGLMYAHIALMTLAWACILPVAVMFSIVSSRYTLVAQVVFITVNAVGVLLSTVYNGNTPDLYPSNAHHSIGWMITFVVSAHVLVSLVGRAAGAVRRARRPALSAVSEESRFLTLSAAALQHSQTYRGDDEHGRGNRSTSESIRSHSGSTAVDEEEGLPMPSPHKEYDNESDDEEYQDIPLANQLSRGKLSSWVIKVASLVSVKLWKYINFGYKTVDRIILPFGFVAYTTGIITYGRLFEGHAVFGGLAHWIKGGVFFWLGILTLGRWAGSFADLGWAWNVRPTKANQKWRPSAEFAESFLIFFYGSTNIFLEHLGGSSDQWSAQDFEHISITVLFIGGGLCGMLIESTWIRDLLNTEVSGSNKEIESQGQDDDIQKTPATYAFSLNPIPALVILLLGIMMSSHTQHDMISTMVHKQWGDMLTAASFARGLTYVMVFLKPPQSIFPSRPPTELLASFGLIAGGILFMASSSDTVEGMIHYDMDAMFMYTVTMGLVGALMSWELLVLSIKGWALRRENRKTRHHFS